MEVEVIDHSAPGFREFEKFVNTTEQKVFQIQEQVCHSRGGAEKWSEWRSPDIVTAERLLSCYEEFRTSNAAVYGPRDWHIRIIGTPPIWTLDDIGNEQLASMRSDGFTPFTTVETSHDNYQVWIKLRYESKSNSPQMPYDDWHRIRNYLGQRYNADKGAGGAGHAFRLPIPQGLSHKRRKPFQLSVIISDADPSLNVEDLLNSLPMETNNKNILSYPSRVLAASAAPPSDVPFWLKQKWDQRLQKMLNSPNCPTKANGEPDWSSIEFRVVSQSLYGYRKSSPEKQSEIAAWLVQLLTDQAKNRNKPKPQMYADRTVSKASAQIQDESSFFQNPVASPSVFCG